MQLKLYIDLCEHWLSKTKCNLQLLFVLLLVSLPISILLSFKFLEQSYLDPSFAGLERNSPIQQIYIRNNQDKTSPLDIYLSQEIKKKWGYDITYERSTHVLATYNEKIESRSISFFSGGFSQLDFNPLLGNLSSLEFAPTGSELVAAISYNLWEASFGGQSNVLNDFITINDKAVKIVAVLPKNFKAFRKEKQTDIVMPFSQQQIVLNKDSLTITPDVFSYLIGDDISPSLLAKGITSYLTDEVMLFDGSKIELNKAIGTNTEVYYRTSKRIGLLKILFYSLLVFCFFSFLTFNSGEAIKKQQEYLVRSMCGASDLDLKRQKMLEMLLTSLLIIVFVVLILPLSTYSINNLFPFINISLKQIFNANLLTTLGMTSLLIVLSMAVVLFIQERTVKTSIGRGTSATLSQKVQGYLLLSLLMTLTLTIVFFTNVLYQKQSQLQRVDLGFKAEQKYVVTFSAPDDIPKSLSANKNAQLLISNIKSYQHVIDAGISTAPPLSGRTSFAQWYTSTEQPIGTGRKSMTSNELISPTYFDSLGSHLIKGERTNWDNIDQVVVNKTLWDSYFSKSTLAQATLLKANTAGSDFISFDIVGVVEDIYNEGPDTPPSPKVYSPVWALSGLESFVIHSDAPLNVVRDTIMTEVNKMDVAFGSIEVTPFDELVRKESAPRNAVMFISIIISIIVLTAAIIFGISSVKQLAERNSREIALRRSIGATFYQLISSELKYIFSFLLPLLLIAFYMLHYYRESIDEYVGPNSVNTLVNLVGISSTLIFSIVAILASIYAIKIKQTWINLT